MDRPLLIRMVFRLRGQRLRQLCEKFNINANTNTNTNIDINISTTYIAIHILYVDTYINYFTFITMNFSSNIQYVMTYYPISIKM